MNDGHYESYYMETFNLHGNKVTLLQLAILAIAGYKIVRKWVPWVLWIISELGLFIIHKTLAPMF